MISAARGKTSATHADWSGALLLVCSCTVDDHAFMMLIAVCACAALPVKYQRSAWV